ncbi:MAG: hypothetical protein IPK03_14380 [Bacteroidetes bacterium]|nr:hypothetical protein [Bacteroidota bacterium]
MEHQSCIAYGNGYKKSYAGNTKMTNGQEFDYIIIHESGHEWFAIISLARISPICGSTRHLQHIQSRFLSSAIMAKKKLWIISIRNLSASAIKRQWLVYMALMKKESGDMYSKGSLFLNTIRHIIDHDSFGGACYTI